MTPQEFIEKYTNKTADFDGKYGSQCVDLYRLYCKEVLNIPQSPGVVGAYQIWTSYLKDYFIAEMNTPDGIPQKGDVLIWDQSVGEYGHVAIYVSGDVRSFTSFDSNWPVGSLPHLQKHDYKGVIGWLRPKVKISDSTMTEEQKRILDFIGSRSEGEVREAFGALEDKRRLEGELQTLREDFNDLKLTQKNLQKQLDDLADKLSQKEKSEADWQKSLTTAKKELQIANESLVSMEEQYSVAEEERKKYKRLYEAALEKFPTTYTWKDIYSLIVKKLTHE